MKIRIEFSESKSATYPWVLRLSRKLPSYRQTIESGITVHSVEFDFEKEWHSYQAIAQRIAGWKNTAFYLDGVLVPSYRILGIHYQNQERRDSQERREAEYGFPPPGTIDIQHRYIEGDEN